MAIFLIFAVRNFVILQFYYDYAYVLVFLVGHHLGNVPVVWHEEHKAERLTLDYLEV